MNKHDFNIDQLRKDLQGWGVLYKPTAIRDRVKALSPAEFNKMATKLEKITDLFDQVVDLIETGAVRILANLSVPALQKLINRDLTSGIKIIKIVKTTIHDDIVKYVVRLSDDAAGRVETSVWVMYDQNDKIVVSDIDDF